jgi:hypothetical protein
MYLSFTPPRRGAIGPRWPALEGCFVQGETVEELLSEAPNAIASHIQGLEGDGQPVPEGGGVIIATVRMTEPARA